MKKKLFSMFLAMTMVLSMAVSAMAVELPAEGADLTGTVVILHTNDSHGRVPAADSSGQAGFTAVSGIKKAYEAAGAIVLLLDDGDTLHGLPIATIDKGADVVKVMNAVGYDAMTPGNHDFNYGTDRLVELSAMMDFPLLSANTIVTETGEPMFKDSVVIEKGGIRFGIFGLSTPETAYKTNPKNVETVTFANPVEVAKAEVEKLVAQDVDYVIALGHIGVDASSEFTSDKIAAAVEGIDIFVDGHSHTAMVDGKPVNNAIILADHGKTVIASTGEYINNIGVITISNKGEINAGLIAYSADLPTDAAINTMVGDLTKAQDIILSEVVGKTAVRLNGERELNRKQETNLGNLSADAILSATHADVAFTNGGGIRASIEAGDITKKDLVTVFPFGNYVVTKEVTGKTIVEVMEHGVRSYPELLGGFPQVAGISFKFDPSKEAGSRVYNVLIGGKAIDLDAKYLLATNDFLAVGGDDYTMLAPYPTVNEFGALEEILTEYIQANPTKEAVVDGRIIAVEETTAAPAEEEKPATEATPVETPVAAENPAIVAEVPAPAAVNEDYTIYTVVSGDTLAKIAKKYTGNANNWKQIYELNKDVVKNPNLIYIGQTLVVPAA